MFSHVMIASAPELFTNVSATVAGLSACATRYQTPHMIYILLVYIPTFLMKLAGLAVALLSIAMVFVAVATNTKTVP